MHSAIYRGSLRHRRLLPRPHEFRYPLFLVYLDLSELNSVFRGRWLWSTVRRAVARFDRRDHLGDPAEPLDVAVRELVRARTGRRPGGPIRLLTHLRYFGHCFNPVSFYYCFDAADARVETVVAEVNNTPWDERHCYVLEADGAPGDAAAAGLQALTPKAMHVSPFMPMALRYEWHLSAPDERLAVHMQLLEDAVAAGGPRKVFDATLDLRRLPLTGANLAGVLLRHPLMTLQVIAAIHWQALRLWLKRIPVHTHPGKLQPGPAPTETNP
ncbi:MAG: DUF1365 domain-containing protein [Betaproteobacteria bacterium]|nr:DUF1365 domain-containing protein [Betaproteobacteria bacterium]